MSARSAGVGGGQGPWRVGAPPSYGCSSRPAPTPIPTPETPLHGAPSSDDLDAANALIDAGADLETPGGSIGTPLDNAIGYGCRHVARRLVERGARVDKLWRAALGQLARIQELLAATPTPGPQINEAFWQACHGGQRRTAEYLLRHGADINTTVEYAHGTALDVAAGPDTRRVLLATWLPEQGARPSDHAPDR